MESNEEELVVSCEEAAVQPDAKKPKASLKKNFIFNFISQVLTLIIPLITAPHLARVLHEVGNGQVSYSLSVITFFTMFASLGFTPYGQREIAKVQDDRVQKSRVFWEILLLRSLFTALSLGVLFTWLFTAGFGENYNKLILILSMQVLAVGFDIQYLFMGDEDFQSIAIRTIVLKLVGLVLIFVFVRSEGDGWVYALCLSASILLSNLIMWPSAFRRISLVKPNGLNVWRHLKPAILIYLPTLAVTVYSVLDKIMIGLLSPDHDYNNGCYEQAYKLNSAALMLVTIISSVLASRNAYDFQQGGVERMKEHLYFACSYVWFLGIPLIFGFAVLSGSLSSWFLGPGYKEVPLLLQIMSVRFVVSGLSVIFSDQFFIVIGKEKYCTAATTAAAVVNVTLNYFLIPVYGAVGAAIATAVCECTVLLVLAVLIFKKKYLSLKRVLLSSLKPLFAGAVMFGVIFLMQHYMGYAIWEFILIMLAGIAVYFLALFALRDAFFLDAAKRSVQTVKARLPGGTNKKKK